MDLIYANSNHEDIGIISGYSFDLAYGCDENDFELQISIEEECCKEDYLVYVEGTEYGGIVDDIDVNTENGVVTYHGRTWHGILDSKIVIPDGGEDYFCVNGEANSILANIISRIGVDSFFKVSTDDSGILIKYRFNRYCKAYSQGILKMLNEANAKLRIYWMNGVINLSVVSAEDYTTKEDFDSDQINFKVRKIYNKVNHLICLGTGELSDRVIIDLYSDKNGVISQEQTYFGMEEIADTYENTSAELQELLEGGIQRFEELLNSDMVDTTLDSEQIYDIGDIVGATEQITGISVVTKVNKKIVKIVDSVVEIEYKTGGF